MAISNHPALLTVTPTARLSRHLAAQQAIAARESGAQAWLPTQTHSFTAWLAALRHEYFLSADDHRTPMDAQQALQLWHQLIAEDVFVGSPRVAELAQRAWRLLHEHALQAPDQWPELLLSEDNKRFQAWAQSYQRLCAKQNLVDEGVFAAELPEHIAAGVLGIPDVIKLHGFELAPTPLQQAIITAFNAAGSKIEHTHGFVKTGFTKTGFIKTGFIKTGSDNTSTVQIPLVQQYATAGAELLGAARWARQSLEKGLEQGLEADTNQSIAIVVPDLSGRVDQVERTLRQVFDPPSFALQGGKNSSSEPWHISLGKPLASWPLVKAALDILQLHNSQFSQPQIHQLLRSPFLPGWGEELPQRYQALVTLARRAPHYLTGQELLNALDPRDHDNNHEHHDDAEQQSQLAKYLAAWRLARRDFQQSALPSQWAQHFQQELTSIGFGQGRALNSQEYQVLQRWHDLLEEFSRLDLVSSGRLSRDDALNTIRERAMGVIFRERNTGVPIEVLGVAEALGSNFDAIWITTLDSNTWPGSLGRDPLIPGVVQETVPTASSEGCLEVARQELRGLLACAPLTQASFARGSEEIALQVATLLGQPEVVEVALEESSELAPMEQVAADAQAPAYAAADVKGGTGVLRNQSACPFRAFAERRLGAVDVTPPRPGLDAAQRGTIVHQALENFWVDVSGSKKLNAMSPEAIEQKIEQAVADALAWFSRQYLLTLNVAAKELEQQRTVRLVKRWLEIEQGREDFEILGHEQKISMQIGSLKLEGKIDRVDQLEDGSTLLIDYKTGKAERSSWFPEDRIKDPQLPAYALTMDPQPGAIAFARLKPDELGFHGLSDAATEVKGITPLARYGYKFRELDEWSDLLDGWHTNLAALAQNFKSGQAAVDPIDANACKYCHLHALCRVNERAPYLVDNREGEADNNDE